MERHFSKMTASDRQVTSERYTCACLSGKRSYRPAATPDIAAGAELALTPEVFVVRGAKYHALYDLAAGNLFQLDDFALAALRKWRDGSAPLSPEEQALLEQLRAEGIPEPEAVAPPAAAPPPLPGTTFALLQVTDLCNLKCIHCYEDAIFGSRDFDFLNLEDAIYAMDELRAVGVKYLQLTGGEPLCNRDIKEIIRYAAGHFDEVEFYTNCLLMNDEIAALLKELGVTVATSVYSYNAMDHDFVTLGRHSYDRSRAGREALQRHDVPCRISTILLDGIELGEQGDLDFNLEQKQDVVRMVGRAGITMLDEKTLDRKLITRDTLASKLEREDVRYGMQCHNCFGFVLYISAQLEVGACPMEKRLIHGSIAARTPGQLREVLSSEIMTMTKDQIEGCRDCEWRYACFDCRPDSMDRPVRAKPWYCSYDPVSGSWDEDMAAKVIRLKRQVRQEIIAAEAAEKGEG